MSDYIKAEGYDEESWNEYLEDLKDMVWEGYDVEGTTPGDLKLVPSSDLDYFPEMELKLELDTDGEGTNYIYFMPVVSFPVLDSTELTYSDDISYYLDKWTEIIGTIAKRLIRSPYKYEETTPYIDEEDEI